MFRITGPDEPSDPWLLNAPTVYWCQGDLGRSSSPGGWLRIFGRCLGSEESPPTIRLSRAAMANIRQNVTIALGLKAVFLVTSVFGLTGLWIAILADTGATVLVTLNALRLLRFNPEREA